MRYHIYTTIPLLLLVLLAACSGRPTEGAREPAGEAAAVDTYRVPGFLPYASAPAMLEVVEEREDTVLVRHLYGETAVPRNPERIYADASTLDILLTLGVIPVAANSSYTDGREPAPLLAPLLERVPQYRRGPVNLEVVASHNPDVILVWDVVVTFAEDPDAMYALLSAVAPTIVLTDNAFTFWQRATDDIAAMLGIGERAAALRDDHAELVTSRCAPIRSALGEEGTITFIGVYPGALWITPPGYTTDTGFIPIGATQWAYQECRLLPGPEVLEIVGADGGHEQLSMEMIPALQADHLIVLTDPAGEAFESLTDSPLWRALPAVQSGNVHAVRHLLYTSYYGAAHVLDIATRIFGAE